MTTNPDPRHALDHAQITVHEAIQLAALLEQHLQQSSPPDLGALALASAIARAAGAAAGYLLIMEDEADAREYAAMTEAERAAICERAAQMTGIAE